MLWVSKWFYKLIARIFYTSPYAFFFFFDDLYRAIFIGLLNTWSQTWFSLLNFLTSLLFTFFLIFLLCSLIPFTISITSAVVSTHRNACRFTVRANVFQLKSSVDSSDISWHLSRYFLFLYFLGWRKTKNTRKKKRKLKTQDPRDGEPDWRAADRRPLTIWESES